MAIFKFLILLFLLAIVGLICYGLCTAGDEFMASLEDTED